MNRASFLHRRIEFFFMIRTSFAQLLRLSSAFAGCLVLFLASSCNDPSSLGSNIFPPEDTVNALFTDSLTIVAQTVTEDSVLVYSPDVLVQLDEYLVGDITDPIFGRYTSEIFSQFRLSATNPNFTDAVLDSVVLILPYATEGHYGDLTQPQTFVVREVKESMDPLTPYYSNQTFNTGPILSPGVLAVETFTPNTTDSVVINGETLAPQLRIPLDNSLGMQLLDTMNRSYTESNEAFQNFFKGINIEADPSNDAMLVFRLSSALAGVRVYYTLDTFNVSYFLSIGTLSAKTSHFEESYSSGSIAPFINNPTLGDSLLYIQGLSGTNAQLDFPYLSSLGNIIVNKAELIVTVADENNLTEFPLGEQLLVLEQAGGDLVLIEDVVVSLQRGGFELFGGTKSEMDDGTTFTRYTMNLSGHFQRMIDGDSPASVYLSLFQKAERPNRLVIGGPNNSVYNMELKLTYTKLD